MTLHVANIGNYMPSDLMLYLYVNGAIRHRFSYDTHYTRRGWRHPAHGEIKRGQFSLFIPVSNRISEVSLDEDTFIDDKKGYKKIDLLYTLNDFIVSFSRRQPNLTIEKDHVFINFLKIGNSIVGDPAERNPDSYYNLRGRFGFAIHEKTSKKMITPIYPINMSVRFRLTDNSTNYLNYCINAHIL